MKRIKKTIKRKRAQSNEKKTQAAADMVDRVEFLQIKTVLTKSEQGQLAQLKIEPLVVECEAKKTLTQVALNAAKAADYQNQLLSEAGRKKGRIFKGHRYFCYQLSNPVE